MTKKVTIEIRVVDGKAAGWGTGTTIKVDGKELETFPGKKFRKTKEEAIGEALTKAEKKTRKSLKLPPAK